MDGKILLGELKEFKRQTVFELQEIRKDVKTLMAFKWKVIGTAGAVSLLATLVLDYFRH